MKNYSEMSDFEINYSVAEKVLKFDELVAVPMFGGAVRWSEGDRDGWNHFNPCNSWADAGPIIAENKIALIWYEVDKAWDASANYRMEYGCWEWEESPEHYTQDANPLRAAMIVFLMMQESK